MTKNTTKYNKPCVDFDLNCQTLENLPKRASSGDLLAYLSY